MLGPFRESVAYPLPAACQIAPLIFDYPYGPRPAHQARHADRELEVQRARTSAGTAASRAANNPGIQRHAAAVLPLIRDLRQAQATWAQIAAWLDEHGVSPPGRRGDYKTGRWTGSAAWRIAKRRTGSSDAVTTRQGREGRLADDAAVSGLPSKRL